MVFKRRPPCTHRNPLEPVRLILPGGIIIGGPLSSFYTLAEEWPVFNFSEGLRGFSDEYHAPIKNYGVPESMSGFHKSITVMREVLEDRGQVLAGCYGGHGRTGIGLACLASLYDVESPVEFVRNKYCPRAVETEGQGQFVRDYQRNYARG